ncbi:hypothetical protein [Niallia circulans]|uniref:hypothetical protein n=1 Tax=Niallia circulans TaxID=1397 RepID=UPI001F36AB99|nr:hypothetical protein [Niallia circulans]MCF2650802.1 hypothetical protein [Niallia circulans]
MLAVAQIDYIRHEVNQKGGTYSSVARKMELDPRTVSKYANQEEFRKRQIDPTYVLDGAWVII